MPDDPLYPYGAGPQLVAILLRLVLGVLVLAAVGWLMFR